MTRGTTKTELFNEATEVSRCNSNSFKKLHSCTAGYLTTVSEIYGKITVLRSYNTIVGVYIHELDKLFVRDYYSNTTYQHIYKFAKEISASIIVYLYRRSDNCFKYYPYDHRRWAPSKAEWEFLEETDFKDFIE